MDSFLNPEEVLDELDLRADMLAADFGCGSGGFTIPLAKRLKQGLVHALDVQKTVLSALRARYISENIDNIREIHCDLEKTRGSGLADFYLSLVIIVNTLFQAEDKTAIISEAKRILKQGGILLIVDWDPKAPQGPVEKRVPPEEVKKIAEELELKMEKKFKAGKYHYGLIFIR